MRFHCQDGCPREGLEKSRDHIPDIRANIDDDRIVASDLLPQIFDGTLGKKASFPGLALVDEMAAKTPEYDADRGRILAVSQHHRSRRSGVRRLQHDTMLTLAEFDPVDEGRKISSNDAQLQPAGLYGQFRFDTQARAHCGMNRQFVLPARNVGPRAQITGKRQRPFLDLDRVDMKAEVAQRER